MRPGDSNLTAAFRAPATAKVLREAAEYHWRTAEQTSDPERYRAMAMDYHAKALQLELGGFGQ